MSTVYSIPVTLGIDEEAIEKKIASDVERHVLSEIDKKLQDDLFNRRYYGDEAYIYKVAREEIVKMLSHREEEIVNMAAEKLADKLARSKAVKEAAGDMAKDIFKK